jgi:hypothetical protein
MAGGYREKDIREAIIEKAKPDVKNKKAPHWKGAIYVGEVFVGNVKIPNDHPRIMHRNKWQFIARSLRLDDDQFDRFVKCSLKGHQYRTILEQLEVS